MALYSLKIFNVNLSPFQVASRIILSLIVVYLGYLSFRHITEFGDIMAHTYSFGGKIINVFLLPIAIVMLLYAVIISFALLRSLLKFLIITVQEGPKVVRNEIEIIKRIWDNRGFGKYKLFGGFSFYFKLRQRVVAFLLAFVSIGIVTWFFAFKQHDYEKTYWKIHFYRYEPIPHFTFLPNVAYTMKTGANIYAITINDKRYVTGKNSYWREDLSSMIPFSFPETWNITFKDTTDIHFEFYAEPINEIFSQSFELWAYKAAGMRLHPSLFVYEWEKKKPQDTKTTKPKKRKKK